MFNQNQDLTVDVIETSTDLSVWVDDTRRQEFGRQLQRSAGIPGWKTFRVHDLRHTHAHLLLESGQNLAVVQGRLHHSSLATTGLYTAAIRRVDPLDVHSSGFIQLRLGVVG